MEEHFKEARRVLSEMPEEAFTLRLDARIKSRGWPPCGFEWEGFLAGLGLDTWKRLKWEKRPVLLASNDLAELSYEAIMQLMSSCQTGSHLVPRPKGCVASIRGRQE